ncbi:MAG: hypothetical protein AAB896_02015 [Patescibacteria group bacterium]
MGPKPIQDVTPPPSGPEIVGSIPVRAPTEQARSAEKPLPLKDDDSSFIVPATPASAAVNRNNENTQTKTSKPKPTLAIVVTLLAIICLAGGAYLKFFSERFS